MAERVFTMLEINPTVLTALSHVLGLTPSLTFHDIYSLDDISLLSLIPRPVHALLCIIPMTPAWRSLRAQEDNTMPASYSGLGPDQPVIWFKQTVSHACGMIGLLSCLMNLPEKLELSGSHSSHGILAPGSLVARLKEQAVPLPWAARAKLLEDSEELFEINEEFARQGDTEAVGPEVAEKTGNHFVAFVKGKDGHLWELEGSRRGPIDRGVLGEEGDGEFLEMALGPSGVGRYVTLARDNGGVGLEGFSCVTLA